MINKNMPAMQAYFCYTVDKKITICKSKFVHKITNF